VRCRSSPSRPWPSTSAPLIVEHTEVEAAWVEVADDGLIARVERGDGVRTGVAHESMIAPATTERS